MSRVIGSVRTLIWIFAVALAAVVGSERIYWYWGGIDPDQLSVLATFYGVAVAVAVAALAMSPGSGLRRAVLGGAVFALVVEGIITPVMYEDGPLPLLFLMFVGWHGLFAFVGLVYVVRKWAVEGRTLRMAWASLVVGVGWGVWALTSAVTDRVTAEEIASEGGGSAEILDPTAFGKYAAWTCVTLIGAHTVADRLWPRAGWRPSPAGLVATAIATAFLAATLVVPVVPWAPLKLGLFGWVLWRLLRRTAAPAGAPTVIDELAGRARLRSLSGLLLLPAAATITYAALWSVRDADVFAGLFWWLIFVQVIVGVASLGWAIRRRAVDDVGHHDARRAEIALDPVDHPVERS